MNLTVDASTRPTGWVPAPPFLQRVLAVIRLQLPVWPASIGSGLLIMTASFVANLALWDSINDAGSDQAFTGGLVSIYMVTFSTYLQSITQIFPFAVGFGVTRRDFHHGLAVLALAQAVGHGLLLEVLGWAEAWSDGWGVGLAFFRPCPVGDLGGAARLLVYIVPFLVMAHVGIGLGITHRRWEPTASTW